MSTASRRSSDNATRFQNSPPCEKVLDIEDHATKHSPPHAEFRCLYADPRTPVGPPCQHCPLMDGGLLSYALDNSNVFDVLGERVVDLLRGHAIGEECERAADAIDFMGKVFRDGQQVTIGNARKRCAILDRRDELPAQPHSSAARRRT